MRGIIEDACEAVGTPFALWSLKCLTRLETVLIAVAV